VPAFDQFADNLVSFIWDVADLLRSPYRPPEYRKVMLPMPVLRRLDCVLESTKGKVLEEHKRLKGQNATIVDKMLRRAAKQQFYNTSKYDFAKLLADPEGLAQNLLHYIQGFSAETSALFNNFAFDQQIQKLDKSNRLFKLVQKFSEVDLHPNVVSNLEMGRSFEELVRKFNEAANEDAGDHFTPREVIRLMVDLIFLPDNDLLRRKGAVHTLFTGDAGSGESNIRKWIIENDWLEGIVALPDQLFYNTGINTYIWIVTNRKAHQRKGKVQLVNAVDLYTKMRKSLGNKRNELAERQIAEIVRTYGDFAESELSKIFDNDDFGYRKITVERPLRLSFSATPEHLAALEASRAFEGMATSRKSGKEGRREIERGQTLQSELLAALRTLPPDQVWMNREEFSAALDKLAVTIPAPVRKAILASFSERDENAAICKDVDSNIEPDPESRDTENVPLKEDIHEYFEREVKPHVPDVWIDEEKTKVGYGAAQEQFNISDAVDFRFPVPPVSEQHLIAKALTDIRASFSISSKARSPNHRRYSPTTTARTLGRGVSGSDSESAVSPVREKEMTTHPYFVPTWQGLRCPASSCW
jgi:type I restriction-modification system DNA methylase subunit